MNLDYIGSQFPIGYCIKREDKLKLLDSKKSADETFIVFMLKGEGENEWDLDGVILGKRGKMDRWISFRLNIHSLFTYLFLAEITYYTMKSDNRKSVLIKSCYPTRGFVGVQAAAVHYSSHRRSMDRSDKFTSRSGQGKPRKVTINYEMLSIASQRELRRAPLIFHIISKLVGITKWIVLGLRSSNTPKQFIATCFKTKKKAQCTKTASVGGLILGTFNKIS